MSVLPLARSRSSGEPRRPNRNVVRICGQWLPIGTATGLSRPADFSLFQHGPDPCAMDCTEILPRDCAAHNSYAATQLFTSARLKAILLSLVEQISSSSAEIHNLWTSIAILLALATLFAVESIWNPSTSTNDTPALVAPIVALITNSGQLTGSHIGITNHTLAIALLTQASNGDTALLAAHDEVWMMLCHRYTHNIPPARLLNPRTTVTTQTLNQQRSVWRNLCKVQRACKELIAIAKSGDNSSDKSGDI